MYNMDMVTMKVSEVRARFKAVIERVKRGEEITLTQNGEAVAVLVRPSSVQARNPAAEKTIRRGRELVAELEEARNLPLEIGRGLTEDEAEEVVAWIRAGRQAR